MSARAYMLKQNFTPSVGLDRRYCREWWRVTQINAPSDTVWTRANTAQIVFAALPFTKGAAHPDPQLVGAICVSITLRSGPWVQADGTSEAMVEAVFDSDRRWGAAFSEGATVHGTEYPFTLPVWTKGAQVAGGGSGGGAAVFNWIFSQHAFSRSLLYATEPRDATGMTQTDKSVIFEYVGTLFSIYGRSWLYRTPSIRRLKTNQTILTYNFESRSPVIAMAQGTFAGLDVALPELDYLAEYSPSPGAGTAPPTVGVAAAEEMYGPAGDPTFLPFWGKTL